MTNDQFVPSGTTVGTYCPRCGALTLNGQIHLCPLFVPVVAPSPVSLLASGWRCPVCDAGVSPFTSHCTHPSAALPDIAE